MRTEYQVAHLGRSRAFSQPELLFSVLPVPLNSGQRTRDISPSTTASRDNCQSYFCHFPPQRLAKLELRPKPHQHNDLCVCQSPVLPVCQVAYPISEDHQFCSLRKISFRPDFRLQPPTIRDRAPWHLRAASSFMRHWIMLNACGHMASTDSCASQTRSGKGYCP
jgi:hypothetical protein